MSSKLLWSFIIGFSVGYIAITATADNEIGFRGNIGPVKPLIQGMTANHWTGQTRMIPGPTTTDNLFYPQVVLLKIKKIISPRDFQYCAGTIISDRYIVTAASCVRYLAYNIQAFVNIQDFRNYSQFVNNPSSTARSVFSVEKIMHRKGFIASLAGLLPRKDLAVLKLKEKIDNPAYISNISTSNEGLGELAKPILMKNGTEGKLLSMTEFKYVAVGYGYNHNPIGEITPRQFKTEVTILPPRTCKNKYPFFDNKTMICAEGYKGTGGPCYNDIGGPILRAAELSVPMTANTTKAGGSTATADKPITPPSWMPMSVLSTTVVGVISAVSARCDQPFVATRVSYFSDWISRNIK